MSDHYILSICIPSYNRFNVLLKTIVSIQKCDANDFEVVIVDNKSENDILSYIKEEKNLKIYKRKNSVSGIQNGRDCLNYGSGRYRMLLLDKDFIDGDRLNIFLNLLRNNSEISGGLCYPNRLKDIGYKLVNRNDFYKWGYKGVHPSGMFIREDILNEENLISRYWEKSSIYNENSMGGDLLLARCLSIGNYVVYKNPLIITEISSEARKIKTHSYTMENMFFFPRNRIKQMDIYFAHLSTLGLDGKDYLQTIESIFMETLDKCTFGLYEIMKNSDICEHYGISTRKISYREMMINVKAVTKKIVKSEYIILTKKQKKEIKKIQYKYYFKIIKKLFY